ncbi:MAG TPA: aminotransferase class V-fold PLP-dependent enzyme [Gemmatimonadales bacterium]
MTSPATAAARRFQEVRETEFPWTATTTYFNNASIGPIPASTRRLLDDFDVKRAQPYLLNDADLMRLLHDGRAAAARLINADAAEIGLATNTSYGLNQAATLLPLAAGDVVLLPEGEFPANVYPWLLLAPRGVQVEFVPRTSAGWPDEERLLERVTDPRVRALAISLVQFASGYRADVARLSAACRAHDTFLVIDAIQGLGHVPFDVRETPVDILSCGAQKWLLAPWGAGFFYVRRELLNEWRPVFNGWMAFEGTDDFSRLTAYDPTPRADARRFEMVTLPFQDVLGMTASVSMLIELGIDRILDHVRMLRGPLEGLVEDGRIAMASPTDAAHDSAIIAVRIDRPAAVHQALRDAGVVCALREGVIRFSPHCYNSLDEMEKVAVLLARPN